MTFRFLMTLTLALGLTACSGGKGTDSKTPTTATDGGDDDDDNNTTTSGETGSTGDTTSTPGGFEPKWLSVRAALVIDGPNQVLATAIDPNYTTATIDSFIEIILGDDAWKDAGGDSTLTDDYCFIDMPLTNSALAAWLPEGAYYGVDYDGGDASALTNCGDATHPIANLPFTGSFSTTAGGTTTLTVVPGFVDLLGPWGAGIGPSTSLIDSDSTLSGVAIGGLLNNYGVLDPNSTTSTVGTDIDAFNHYYAYPFALDANLTLEYDDQGNPVLIDPSQVFDGVAIASGVYSIRDIYLWQLLP